MNRFERIDDPVQALLVAFRGNQAGIWTALPGFITKVMLDKQTCNVQTTVQMRRTLQDNSKVWVTVPELLDCPLIFPSGGGFTLTFPVAVGDECLVIFASRCIDGWWKEGGVKPQTDLRMHDLSDGFVIPGPRNQKNLLPNISSTAVELRNEAGTASVSIDAANKITLTSPTEIDLNAPIVRVNGNIITTGTILASGTITGPTGSI